MPRYEVYAPVYLNGIHHCPDANLGNPKVLETADDVVPSVKWTPLDEAALKAHKAAIERIAEGRCYDVADKEKRAQIFERTRKEFTKAIKKAQDPKPVAAREISTMQDVAASGRGTVVGRASDKSPV